VKRSSLSLVIPVFDEADGLPAFFERVLPVLEQMKGDFEIICVDDGSRDRSVRILSEWHKREPRIKVIRLSRNFGKEAALSAGLRYCRGDGVIPMDADLQDPPELIPHMVKQWRNGIDVVYAVRNERAMDSSLKRFTAEGFYRFFNRLSKVQLPENVGDFRLMDRRVVEVVNRLPERVRFMKGLFAWVGFSSAPVYYDRPSRTAGSSKWSYWRLWNLAVDGVTAYSTVPLRVWSYLGAFIALVAFVYAGYIILKTLVLGADVPGYASLLVFILFFGGINLVVLGTIGEYLGRIYEESKRRPLYVVSDLLGDLPRDDAAPEKSPARSGDGS
jgi:glycosyltransferase involved in cell wall biosynthesis